MVPPATRYHHQLWINRLARVKVRPFPRLPLVSIPQELVVGGAVGEVLWIIEIRLRECLGLLVWCNIGHAIEVEQLWHWSLVVF